MIAGTHGNMDLQRNFAINICYINAENLISKLKTIFII